MKKALITGITGQDGSYLAEFLLKRDYKVYGFLRDKKNLRNIKHLKDKIVLIEGNITNLESLEKAIVLSNPDEIYNLAAQSFVGESWNKPLSAAQIDGLGVAYILETIRTINKKVKFYQASTSELFGLPQEIPQTETTPFYPRSPYAVAKLYGHWITKNYRESYGVYACSGILFNHESPRRGKEYVTRKITDAVARIKYGIQEVLLLGNLNAKKDWGYAGDYVKAMWLMLQQEIPDDYAIATGETHEVREFVELAFEYAGIDIEWKGQGVDEQGINKETGEVIVKVTPEFFRPVDTGYMLGNPEKARKHLGWERSVTFSNLVKLMVEEDLNRIRQYV